MDHKDVKIGSPCTLDWRKMTPAEGGRFCGDCKKVVRDLSRMTEREARAMLKRASGGEHRGSFSGAAPPSADALCVRYVYDNQGRIFFGADAPRRDVLLSPSSLLQRARRVAAAAAVVALPFATQACEAITEPLGLTSTAETEKVPDGYHENMGGIGIGPEKQIADSDASADGSTDDADPGSDAAHGDADQDGGTDDSDAEPPAN